MKLKKYILVILAVSFVYSFTAAFGDFGVPAREDMYYYFYATAPDETEEREFEIPGKYYGSGASYGVAIMLVDQLESGLYQARVMWGYDATKYTEWTMTLHPQSDGKWTYDDCECADITVDENENLDIDIRYNDGSGYFVIGNWCFSWEGAYETGCRSIVFEK